jgi:phage-related protein
MPLGFNIRTFADPRYICPDRKLSKTVTSNLYDSKFGDGYRLKVKDGINSIDEVYSLSFLNRSYEEIHAIKRFFELRKGLDKFEFFPVEGSDPITVVCDTYDIIQERHNLFTCRAVFKRIYDNPEPVEEILLYVAPDTYVLQGYIGVG